MSAPVSGTPVSLRAGRYTAEIASVGASLRSLTADGRDLVVPFAEDAVRPYYRGAVLVPWPNRVIDARWTDAGTEQQLAVTEPERGHALHGLAVWTDYAVADASDDRAVLTTEVPAQAGYPHRVAIEVAYALGQDGLTASVTATNTGPTPAPYGAAPHPYLVAGPGRVDDWTVQVPAARVMRTEGERLLPAGLAPVDGTPFDLRTPTEIGDRRIDHALTGLPDGVVRARVTAADGNGVEIVWDADAAPWVQVHTADRPEPAADRVGLAVEPMTCPPDAFNSRVDLVELAPGASHTLTWRIAALPAEPR